MSKESEITPFSNKPSSSPVTTPATTPKSVRMRRAYNTLKWGGLAGFWIQICLGVVSSVTLALAITNQSERSIPGIGFSLFCAVCGIICLIVGICISFRYGKIANQFIKPQTTPPKKSTTIKIIQIGIITSMVGTAVSILGAETIAGIVLSKTLSFDPAKVFNNQSNTEFVNSLDVFIIQACINIIAAHFAGLVSSIWMLTRIEK
jgi:hypothetical protein